MNTAAHLAPMLTGPGDVTPAGWRGARRPASREHRLAAVLLAAAVTASMFTILNFGFPALPGMAGGGAAAPGAVFAGDVARA